MLQLAKRACALCMALILVLAVAPLPALRVHAEENEEKPTTLVQNTLDFTKMPTIGEGRNEEKTAANKAKVRDELLAAGAVECENLFLKGNWEVLVNPGGYNKQGYYVQKISAAEGETIENAYLNMRYWICDRADFADAEQGYIEVHVSSDNVNYEMIWSDRESHGAQFEYIPQELSMQLPVVEGQTELYVKFIMEHWSTYEGAGIAYSTLTINSLERPVETDKLPHECTMVTGKFNFNTLNPGEVTAEQIGAVSSLNMLFGMDGVPLLSPRNGYEMANAVWMVQAAEGEPLNDCVVKLTGRTHWINEAVKDQNYLRVYASVDGVNYTLAQEFRATDDPSDTQVFTIDITEIVQGYAKAYVKLEWMLYDSPHLFGLRSVEIVGNTTGIDPTGESNRMVFSNVQCFSMLPVGEVDKADISAFKSANLMFGYDKTPLLTVTESGEDAYATWRLTASEGETFANCYLVLVGKVGVINADKKDTTKLTVSISIDDGDNYTKVLEMTPDENQADDQQIVIDLSVHTAGLTDVLVKVYFTTEDDPACMGLRAMALVANAGAAYVDFIPPLMDRVITDEEMGVLAPPATEPEPTEPSAPAQTDPPAATDPVDPPAAQEPSENGWTMWAVVAVVVIAVVAAVITVVVVVIGKVAAGKKKANS